MALKDIPIVLYTDGSYTIGRNKGGWAFVHADETYHRVIYSERGDLTNATNNVAELMAVINAIEYAIREYPDNPIEVLTDSQYVQKGFHNWVDGWKEKGWVKYNGAPILNLELWKKLYEYKCDVASISISWVRGHDSDFFNEIADELAGNY